jgi:drug/metabolite transporter (DMT)-like permease
MKQYWKMTASWVAMSPLAIHYFRKEGIPKLSLMGWFTFVAAIVCYSTSNVLFVTSLEYTTIGNAVIYANSQALLLIFGKACVGDRIHCLEGVGVLIAFTGAILCSRDAQEQSSHESATKTNGLYGDVLALVSAIAGLMYLAFAKAVRRSGISVSVFVFSVMFFGSFLILIFMFAISSKNNEHPIEWNANPYDGVFGWLTLHRLPILLYLAVMCNMVGTMGFVRGACVCFSLLVGRTGRRLLFEYTVASCRLLRYLSLLTTYSIPDNESFIHSRHDSHGIL